MSASRLPKRPEAPPWFNRFATLMLLNAAAWAIVIAVWLLILAPILASAIRYVLGNV